MTQCRRTGISDPSALTQTEYEHLFWDWNANIDGGAAQRAWESTQAADLGLTRDFWKVRGNTQ